MVVDYRLPNEAIIDEIFDIPRVFEGVQMMGNMKWFSSIDLKKGFNQLRLDKASKNLRGFTVSGHHLHYNRIPDQVHYFAQNVIK